MKVALSVLLLIVFQNVGAAVNHNTLLQFTMKNISKDTTHVEWPTTQEFGSDVDEERLVNAITRSRTAAYLLKICDEKKEGELAPTILKPLTPEEKQAKLVEYSKYIGQSIDQLKIAEKQLLGEHAKTPDKRDFKALKKTMEDLNVIIKAAHAVFQETE